MEHPGQSAEGQPLWEGQHDPTLLLSTLAAARTLAHAEQSALLPVALRELLRLSGCRAGLVVTCSQGVKSRQASIQQQVRAEVVRLFIECPLLLETLYNVVVTRRSGQGAEAAAGGMPAKNYCIRRLASAGIQWYLALPLLVDGQIEAVVVALGEQPPAEPAVRLALASASTLLGEIASTALEQAHLRHLLSHEKQARDEFIGLASHELKSPLAIIKGYAQLLLRQARRADGAGVDLAGLEAISQQVTRMSNLVGELLDVSRVERGVLEVQPRPLELVGLVERLVQHRQRSLEEMVLQMVAREPALQVLADPARLEQALGYLLDNAVRFGPESGPVEVLVERAPLSRVPPTVLANPAEPPAQDDRVSQKEVALISIRDYGLGVPLEERGRLFTAFYRGPEQGPHRQLAGLGLGLYLSHYLAVRQHGRVWAEFPDLEDSGGSFFYLSLPLLPAS